MSSRREFLKLSAQASAALGAASVLPPAIRNALAIPAAVRTGTIKDVKHVVILMQENRSFDHYFGTLKGVRGFGDRHTVPLPNGRSVWQQSDGAREIPPFHLDTKTTSALRVPGTPHSFADSQAAWNQGSFGAWPKYKTEYSMGYYRREDIPFQFALAESFTICDAYHCSITTGTDPNRIVFFSGSNFDPLVRARGENCTDRDSSPNNLRCWIKGALPTPGYEYQGSAFNWPTIPDALEQSGVSWRVYQDPNNNWTGAMHGGLAFASFRNAQPESALYRHGMSHWSLEQLARDVQAGTLPQVSWILPPRDWSEHPGPSSPVQGAEFTSRVLEALTSNPDVWASTVFFQTFDENDGLFDHAPPPAVPSFDRDGKLVGKSTLDLTGHYFHDHENKYLHSEDTVSGAIRPWGLGPRVPMYVVSPWSKGGWVCSQVFDHTSVGQFLEKRFDMVLPGISPWHRAVCGDLTSAFDFSKAGDASVPQMPDVSGASAVVLAHIQRPKPMPPAAPQELTQERGVRGSRALPYELGVDPKLDPAKRQLSLVMRNSGQVGAVLHVYDRLHLERIPRRYTIEAGKSLTDVIELSDERYDLWIYGPNGFVRELKGALGGEDSIARPEVLVR
ncbi:MAG TPA: phospholipase C, phosphocholine-specific, partial [Steroidobacteraceae bacterium]|nr:phospholipase C, phosphocholine-specific [Steroidobacteraceae bacterium]